MISFSILFLLGNLYLQTYTQFPSGTQICIATMSCILASCCLYKYSQFSYLPAAFMLGFIWSAWCANSLLAWTLPLEMEGNPVIVKGYIASLPIPDKSGVKFDFQNEELEFQNKLKNGNARIRLTWSNPHPYLHAGDKWRLCVRLKRIHGVKSPGAFDFEAWALQNGIRASGHVTVCINNRFISHHWFHFPVEQLRQYMFEQIRSHLDGLVISPWLLALIIGVRVGITQNDWQILRNTGTNHLMAIAGLHIGIVAAMIHITVTWLWRRASILSLYIPAQMAGACAALLLSILYSALAGYSIPTQRACLMLTLCIITIISRRNTNAWHVWSLALLMMQLINPLCVLTVSFWLSFITIALIIYGMGGRLQTDSIWWRWGRVQWVIGAGLVPMTLALYQECSLISFAANTIAIPWLEFFILPFCLIGSCLIVIIPSLGVLLLLIANRSLMALWAFLAWLARFNVSVNQFSIADYSILAVTMLGFVLLLVPAGLPGRWLGIVWIAPALLFKPAKPASGDIWFSVLDVGQGLSIVVQTYQHTLIYDAGPSFSSSFDMGESVVVPYLRLLSANVIDMLVISHGDNDHIGGAFSVLRLLDVKSVQSSVPDKITSTDNHYCRSGISWSWDGVNFTFLNPSEKILRDRNNNSCVLMIDNGEKRVLLTGDIEKSAEIDLLARIPGNLPANIMIAPHHGSKTSGMPQFIQAVHPQIVVYATGYRNRYHFPHPGVAAAYAAIHAQQYNTVNSGTIQFKLEKGKSIARPDEYRVSHKKYWNE